jgi:hypothetical protein
VPGFRVEPHPLPTTVQVPEFGSTRNMGGYTDHSTVPARACSSVHVANTSTSRAKASSHSHIPQFGATDLRNAAEATDQNQPPDGPASSHKKNPSEVYDTIVSILLLGVELRFLLFHLTWLVLLPFCVVRTMEGNSEGSTTQGHWCRQEGTWRTCSRSTRGTSKRLCERHASAR